MRWLEARKWFFYRTTHCSLHFLKLNQERGNMAGRSFPLYVSAYKRADLSSSAASEDSTLVALSDLRPFTSAGSPFHKAISNLKMWIWNTHQHAVDIVGPQVFARGLQQPPVSSSVVGDVGLHLVVCPLVGQEHPLDTCHLQHPTGEELTKPPKPQTGFVIVTRHRRPCFSCTPLQNHWVGKWWSNWGPFQ